MRERERSYKKSHGVGRSEVRSYNRTPIPSLCLQVAVGDHGGLHGATFSSPDNRGGVGIQLTDNGGTGAQPLARRAGW